MMFLPIDFDILIDEDEETPEIIGYEMVECFNQKSLGRVSLGPDGRVSDYWLKSNTYFISVSNYFGVLDYRPAEKAWYAPSGWKAQKLFELKPIVKRKKKPTDICGRCNAQGVFIRTALVCPVCKAMLGGF